MPDKTTIIFLGDISGSLGRQAIKEIVPVWQKKYHPDLFLANVENLAHNKGVTIKTLQEIKEAGIDIFTSGNHIWAKYDISDLAKETDFALVCPANDSRTPIKFKQQIIEVNKTKLIVLNLSGQTFMEDEHISNPFHKIDNILEALPANINIILDFHAEATSEKRAMGFYLDGRVSAVIGTHTHIPTADAQILDKGTGYITDIGMVGAFPSVLGIKQDIIIDKFLTESNIRHDLPESGQIEINAVLLEIDNKTHQTNKIELLRTIIH